MTNKFLLSQDVMKYPGGSASAGFNQRVHGNSYSDTFKYPHQQFDRELSSGWYLADEMIRDGKLFYVHNFHDIDCPKGYAFPYGGTWACNTCNRDHFEKEWWKIKVFKDGNAWCCIGVDFENLQESENYAFGDMRDEAIRNYGLLMSGREAAQGEVKS